MEVEYSSEELALEEHTVPSKTEHEFLAEGIEDLYNHHIAKVQIAVHKTLEKLLADLEEARKQKSLGTNMEERRLVTQIKNLREAQTRAINRYQQLREELYESLKKWEEMQEDFGDGVE